MTNETENKNYNISILIDLSDRIDTIKHSNPTMEYYNRDLGYIKSVSEALTHLCVEIKEYTASSDLLQVLVKFCNNSNDEQFKLDKKESS